MFTMLDVVKLIKFEWDEGNIHKSYKKHKITPNQAEEIFLDENVTFIPDLKHSQLEPRFIAIGKSYENLVLFCVFTIRKNLIRILSTRPANLKERRHYEKAI